MQLRHLDFQERHEARGPSVVIDVLRAFTTAAYALGSGAAELWLASTLEQAWALRRQQPTAALAGEVAGTKPPRFDFGNSPAELLRAPLDGRVVILLSGAGAPGASVAAQASPSYAASFVCAGATARRLRAVRPESVTFVITGTHCGWDGDEDLACAEYVGALARGEKVSARPYLERVCASVPARNLTTPAHPEYAPDDLALALEVSRFDFALRLTFARGRVTLRAEA